MMSRRAHIFQRDPAFPYWLELLFRRLDSENVRRKIYIQPPRSTRPIPVTEPRTSFGAGLKL